MSSSRTPRKRREHRNVKRPAILKRTTPYPWRRDAKGNLTGANGHAIYFMGEDAILVEHAPVMLEAPDLCPQAGKTRGTSSERRSPRNLAAGRQPDLRHRTSQLPPHKRKQP
jgi:hypothetical protein